MSKDYGGYFFTTKTGVRVFVPTTKEESKSLAHDLNKNARRSKTGTLSRENLRIAREAYKRFKHLEIRFREPRIFEWLCEELDNNLTAEEKGSPLVCDEIGDNIYVAINFGHNEYAFIGEFPIGSLDFDSYDEQYPEW